MDEALPYAIGLVLINHNDEQGTISCIEKVAEFALDISVFVVDNSSIVRTSVVDKCKELHATFLRAENNGYAAAANIGLSAILENGAKYILVFNTDVVFDEQCLLKVMKAMDADESIWVAGPRIFNIANGELTTTEQSCGQRISPLTGKAHRREFREGDTIADVEYVSGAAMFIRCEALLQSGLFDESFFLYYEETEFCARINRLHAGKRVIVVTDALLWHQQGVTTTGLISTYYGTRNKIIFHKMFMPQFHIAFLLYTWFIGSLGIFYHALYMRHPRLIKVWLVAVLDGMKGVKGKKLL